MDKKIYLLGLEWHIDSLYPQRALEDRRPKGD
jgi:hypothetical protein